MPSPQLEDGHIRIATELFEAECRVKMSGSEWQVYKFIQRKTYGWQKRRDAIGYGQFVKGTGLDRRRAIEAVKSLENRGMLVVTKSGLGKPNVYEIQKNYKKWQVVTKSGLVTKSGKSSDKKRTRVVTKTAPTITTLTKDNTIGRERASRLPHKTLPAEWKSWTRKYNPRIDAEKVFERFRDYWIAVPGQKGLKLDWLATWRNWVRKDHDQAARSDPDMPPLEPGVSIYNPDGTVKAGFEKYDH